MNIYIKMLSLLILVALLTMCATAPKKVEEIDVGFCISCHQERTPGLFQSWVESKHAKNGVHCVTCHIDHQAASDQRAMVFPKNVVSAIRSNWKNFRIAGIR